jgi:predicted enzyme related to lactoylglutathione lyase
MATLRDKFVAGLGPQMNTEVPPFWTVYVTVADADATLAAADAAGGTIVVPAMDVLDAGRMGMFQDSVGSFIAVWQPHAHAGCQLVNEPGTFVWSELATTDLAKVREFYLSVFGWGLDEGASSDAGAIFTVSGDMVCGAHVAGPGEFNAWLVWFAVDDCDGAVEQVTALGGTVIVPPNDMGFGRGAVVADTHGAAFGIGAMAS